MSPTLLVTMCGRKAYLARAARGGTLKPRLFGVDADSDAPTRSAWDGFEVVPRVDAPNDGYLRALEVIVEREGVDAVVCVNDTDAAVIAHGRERLEACGARVMGPDALRVDVLSDKLRAASWLTAQGFATPETRTVEHVRREGPPGPGPWFVKPRHGQGSRGVMRVSDARWFELLDPALLVQPEQLGTHYDLDVLRDAEGSVVVSAKEKLTMSDGTALITRSSVEERWIALGTRIADAVGHVGLVDADVVLPHDGGPATILEINPRVGGCFAHACVSDVGLSDAWVRVCDGHRVNAQDVRAAHDVVVYRDPTPVCVRPSPPGGGQS